jgi:hypothetical protein
MSDRGMRALSLVIVAAAGVLAARPAYACHLATGWCCIESGASYYCCYFENNQLRQGSCGFIQPT